MPLAIVTGEPGSTWTNNTERAMWQFHANWNNTCGQCAQFDGQVARYWPIPIHARCRCRQTVIFPGQQSQPFTDFRETIAALDPKQQTRVVGRANLILIEEGVVEWGDVVTKGRIRTFAEVVSREKLTLTQLTQAGIPVNQARRTLTAVHTPEITAAKASAQAIYKGMIEQGYTPAQITGEAGKVVASRVVMSGAPVRGGEKRVTFGNVGIGMVRAIVSQKIAALVAAPQSVTTFGPSKAEVEFDEDYARDDIDKACKRTVGRVLSPEDYANISGATSDAKVTVSLDELKRVTIYSESDNYHSLRVLLKDKKGPYIYNESFVIDRENRGAGIGTEVFGREVEHAAELGFTKIKTSAARGPSLIGYKVWPKFGYDGPLTKEQQLKIDRPLSATKISQLYATPEGIAHWEKHGETIDLTFDLAEGSYSRKAWADYLKAKAEKKKEQE